MTLADRYDAFLFDLDGVLYRGSEPIPGAGRTIEQLREAGKRVVFMTNNSSRTPEAVVDHLGSVGIHAEADEVETSALATATFVSSLPVGSAFVVGEEGLRQALLAVGIELRDGDPDSVDAVVVGFDRSADWMKLRTASVLVEHGAKLVASNADPSYPAPDGDAWPGAGALLAVVEATTGVKADVVGKPNPPLFEAALARAGDGRPLVIGDRLDTDIRGAIALRWDSMLVLTGISTREEAARWQPGPTYIAGDLTALLEPGRAGERFGSLGYADLHIRPKGLPMRLDELRRGIEAALGNLTPAKAQDLARSFLEPGAAKDQVAKTANELMEWSTRNRTRLRDAVRKEIADQMKQVGVATQADLDAVKKRVRELERGAGKTASGRRKTAARSSAAKSSARSSTARSGAPPAEGSGGPSSASSTQAGSSPS